MLSTDAVGANANVTHADSATFKIIDAKLYIPVATLSTLSAEDNARLANQSDVYWSKDKMIDNKKVKTSHANEQKPLKELFDSSYQGVKRLFRSCLWWYRRWQSSFCYSFKKYSLPRVKIEKYNIVIDGRNFYDELINNSIKQYDEVRKVSTGQGDDYATGCLLDFTYFKNNYRLIAADLRKQKALDVDLRAIQQVIFTGKIKLTVANTRVMIYYILQQSKETILKLSKGTKKVL